MASQEDKTSQGFETRAVHSGEWRKVPTGTPVVTPVYSTATFTYSSMAEMDRVFSGETSGFVYSRYGNPTVASLESLLLSLEGGAGACAYGSGMAALHAALLACEIQPGASVLASQDLYGATLDLLLRIFGMFNIETVTADYSDIEALAKKAREIRPSVMIAETISNPLLKLCDLDATAAIAKEVGAKFVVDSTFTTPFLCRPLEHGADFVVHSATKYLSGHTSAMGGCVIAREAADHTALISIMKLVGGILGPWEAHEIMRGAKTLPLRVGKQCSNAKTLAETLSKDARVKRVFYPLLDEPQVKRDRLLRASHSGMLVTIVLADDTREGAFRFMDSLKMCMRSTSLGDVFTSVLHPATASHREMPPSRRRQLGISDGLVRISVGIENIDDILADIDQALTIASPVAAGASRESNRNA